MGDEAQGLELDESQRFAEREATAERVGRLLMAAIMITAVLGLFANGPLSHRDAESDNVKLRYQRFGRNQGRTSLEVEAQPTAATEGTVQVWVAQDFLDSYDVEDVQPEPETTTTRSGGIVFSFPVEGTDTAVKATVSLRPRQTGRHRGALAVGDGRPVVFTQFVYP
jgi:hypothetical protein